MSKVLLLCAHPGLRNALSDLVEQEGHTAVGPEDALRCDVVVADCDPISAGWSLKRLRRQFARTPTILMSSSPWAGPAAASTLMRGYFLAKPCAARQFRSLLDQLLPQRAG